ncbi:hypothetical protein EST38_g6732 [Candolleomyces aberdarensis]|uniref:Uncharacterized protein n=1 Tax=Candolleomyces aberdarensis TaxID=2316362 RepID=A0A4Q2DJ51_9AGAR|nr:hypothetical protein EST38_g6732 [Candolleomyces aberdarensis]
MTRATKLFEGYPALIQGYNAFLPEGHRIETNILNATNEYSVTITTPTGTESAGDSERVKIISATLPTIVKDENSPSDRDPEGAALATQYIEKLTTRYAGNTSVIQQFMESLRKYMYNKDAPDSDKIAESEMKELLKDQPDLVGEFDAFWKTIIARQNS